MAHGTGKFGKKCSVCGRYFTSVKIDARYDRAACRQKMSRAMRALAATKKKLFGKEASA